jgi:hypothetical protein
LRDLSAFQPCCYEIRRRSLRDQFENRSVVLPAAVIRGPVESATHNCNASVWMSAVGSAKAVQHGFYFRRWIEFKNRTLFLPTTVACGAVEHPVPYGEPSVWMRAVRATKAIE